MKFTRVAEVTLPLQPQLQWLWYSSATDSFIVGDDTSAFAIPSANLHKPEPLSNSGSLAGASNLPISDALLTEFCSVLWNGFHFLDRSIPQPAGDLLRTLVFGPNYDQCLHHPATDRILAVRSGSMQLLKSSPTGPELLDQTKTRGKAALAFAAHPTEPLIAYGDNYGLFHLHRFDESKFGKASKFADKQRNASKLEFSRDGRTLLLCGMGYLSKFSYADGKCVLALDEAIAVKDFVWLEDISTVIVNGGMHGLTTYRCDESGFTKLGELKNLPPLRSISMSADQKLLATTYQDSAIACIYSTS